MKLELEEYSQEAYLKAMDRILSGRAPTSSLLTLVRQCQAEYDRGDIWAPNTR